jgi:uncharacterized protein (DUF2062 family)
MQRAYAWMPTVDSLRESRMGRLLGNWLLHPNCWSFKPGPSALGIGVALFIAWTPTIGIQVALTLVACCLLRANIPLAVLIPWISNPVTVVPIFAANLWVGLLVTGQDFPWGKVDYGDPAAFFELVASFVGPLWIGSVIVGLIVGVVGYFATFGFIYWQRQVHLIDRLRERAAARARRVAARRVLREKRRSSLMLRRQKLLEAARMRVTAKRPFSRLRSPRPWGVQK